MRAFTNGEWECWCILISAYHIGRELEDGVDVMGGGVQSMTRTLEDGQTVKVCCQDALLYCEHKHLVPAKVKGQCPNISSTHIMYECSYTPYSEPGMSCM